MLCALLTKTIEGAQRKVEGNNFAIRKHVLKYDDVMNKQREIMYGERRKVLEGEDLKDHIQEMVSNLISENVEIYTRQAKYPEEWDFEGLEAYLMKQFGFSKGIFTGIDIENLTKEGLIDYITEKAFQRYDSKEKEFSSERFREIERIVLLQVVDRKWMDHIDAMDQLRQGIGLRAYGQEDPVRAYQIEGFDMFEEMNHSIQEDSLRFIMRANISSDSPLKRIVVAKDLKEEKSDINPAMLSSDNQMSDNRTVSQSVPVRREAAKVGRNDPCSCGSGKKYKNCCGRNG